MGFAQDRQGTIWAATGSGLARLEGDRWKDVGEDWNFPGKSAHALFLDRQGTLWVATEDTLVFLPSGARRFQPTGITVGQVLQIAQAANGKLWMAETTRSVRPIPISDKRQHPDGTEIQVGSPGILFDNDGALWITSSRRRASSFSGSRVAARVRSRNSAPAVESFTSQGWIKRRFCPRNSSRPRRKYLGRNQQRSGSLPQNEPGAGRSPLQARICCFGCRRRRGRLDTKPGSHDPGSQGTR